MSEVERVIEEVKKAGLSSASISISDAQEAAHLLETLSNSLTVPALQDALFRVSKALTALTNDTDVIIIT